MSEWLTVDRNGLAKIVMRRGVAFVLYELIQNAWDTQAITDGMRHIRRFAQELAKRVLKREIRVYFENDPKTSRQASYGNGALTFNVGRLGAEWFDQNPFEEGVLDLIIHEFGHEYESNHLSSNYYAALTKLGAKVVRVALAEPGLFNGRS